VSRNLEPEEEPDILGEPPLGLARVAVERAARLVEPDWVVVEEPLQIRVEGEALAVTMRTPGHDRELAAGFVFTEGIVDDPGDFLSVEMATDVFEAPHPENTVNVRLTRQAREKLPERRERVGRDFRAVSACGVCGKKTIASLRQNLEPIEPVLLERRLVYGLPERMRERQRLFRLSGGIHAAALFSLSGELLGLYEDIGRHNAVDKLIGHALLAGGAWPLRNRILVLSGRVGFEVVQKALRAGVPTIVAVGAASSLAVKLVEEAGATLYSFVGRERGNRHV